MKTPTPQDLATRLTASGSKDRFGETAAEVLDLAELVAAAQSQWDKGAIAAFQDAQKIHPKVWGKLVSIARSANLASLPKEDLPTAYSALYALEVMSPEELQAAISEKVVKSTASTRAILDWTKAYRLRGTGVEQEIPLTLVLREELSKEQHQDLLSALQEVAGQFGAELLEGKGGLKQATIKAEARKARAQEIEEELLRLIGPDVLNAPVDLKSKFRVTGVMDFIEAPRSTFTGFFQMLVAKEEGAFWTIYGRAYALKIAREFNLTESRTERFQLKKRLKDAIKYWGPRIDGFESMVNEILSTYMDR